MTVVAMSPGHGSGISGQIALARPCGFDLTADRLVGAIAGAGMHRFAPIDHDKGAWETGK